jgi:hypothetical protein
MVNMREIAAEYRLSHWAEIIRERNESGKSIKAYCESIGIRQNVYHYWQKKLREAACERLFLEAGTMKPLDGTTPNSWVTCEIEETPTSADSVVIVEVGKFKVSVKNGDDMTLFAKVCQALVTLC